jgi:hypothetical protein
MLDSLLKLRLIRFKLYLTAFIELDHLNVVVLK